MTELLPIVRFIARRIHDRLPQHVPIEDLYSAGVVGLLDALGKFDPSKQVQFRSYAKFRIRGQSWTACGRWTGARANYGERGEPLSRQSRN
jgi:DNA-directed RNA polymerase specialized sigma subunit